MKTFTDELYELRRDANHYRRMLSQGNPDVGVSLAARALEAADREYPSVGSTAKDYQRGLQERHGESLKAEEVLAYMTHPEKRRALRGATPPAAVKISGYRAETVLPYSGERAFRSYREGAKEHARKSAERRHFVWGAMRLRCIRQTGYTWYHHGSGVEEAVVLLHGKAKTMRAWFRDGRCLPVEEIVYR